MSIIVIPYRQYAVTYCSESEDMTMTPKKKYDDFFDDNFEVTFEETNDLPFREDVSGHSDNARFAEDDFLPEKEDDYEEPDPKKTVQRKQRRNYNIPLAAPIRKGGKTLTRLVRILIRQFSLALILATSIFVTYNFWRASTPYGDIIETIRAKTIPKSLAAYFSVAAVFLLFEFIAFIWSMTRTRVRDGIHSWKEDTGRGLSSFIFVFAASYFCFFFSSYIPDTNEFLYGFKGALDVYGSLHNALSGFCAAGVISCLVRKYML